MKQYLDLLRHVRDNGTYKEDRTGTGTYSCFGAQLRFKLQEGFPVLTTKRLFFKGVIAELLWFLRAGTNIDFLNKLGVHIWDEWAKPNGDLGKIYGHQWRNWNDESRDQIADTIEQIKKDPSSRRHVISAWNVSQLGEMALLPCHLLFMFYVADGKLSCHFIMRSTDVGLGLPFNIASYALLTHMVAQVTGLEPGELIYTGNDVHIYANHLEQLDEQLTREPYPLPKLWMNEKVTSIDDFTMEDFRLIGYKNHSAIKMPIAV